ncbi:hypothetical protein Rhopal_002623-T1 [Rhodotorula paludigena]|uniref:Uncharacterized protein n=1 Tax=Rhodotorula paludigena TaxID=86838 RepID=A0AAV5GJG5_9BASI|nr:hypothetical protein Rhopal_002623-T1 [Rhodotorula paludigena]
MSDVVSERRGSAAPSVSVIVETTTTTSLAAPAAASLDSTTWTTISACPARRNSAQGSATSAVPPGEDVVDIAYTFPPPPAYDQASNVPSTLSPSVDPLSFYTFPAPPAVEILPHLSPSDLSAPSDTSRAPPAYAATPQTRAERCFWFGFLCPPLWLWGLSFLWRSQQDAEEAAAGAKVAKEDDPARLDRAWNRWSAHPSLEEAVLRSARCEAQAVWRAEERLWAKSVGGFGGFCCVLLVMLLNVLGVI